MTKTPENKIITVGPNGDYDEILPAIARGYEENKLYGFDIIIQLMPTYILSHRLHMIYTPGNQSQKENFIELPKEDLSWLTITSLEPDALIIARGALNIIGLRNMHINYMNMSLEHSLLQGTFLSLEDEAKLFLDHFNIGGYQHNFDSFANLSNHAVLDSSDCILGAKAFTSIVLENASSYMGKSSTIENYGQNGILSHHSTIITDALHMMPNSQGARNASIQANGSILNCSSGVIDNNCMTVHLNNSEAVFHDMTVRNHPKFYNFVASNGSKVDLFGGDYSDDQRNVSHMNIIAEGHNTEITLNGNLFGQGMGLAGGRIIDNRG